MNITPQQLHRIHDSSRGALRFFEKERERCLRYTNTLYGRVCREREAFMQSYADAFRAVVGRSHRVRSCRASISTITLQFPDLPAMPDFSHVLAGEVVIHLPEKANAFHYDGKDWHRDMPWVQWRRPGDRMVFRRRQISPRETPAQTWARCSRFFEVHALANHQHQAA
jgi:hypothetical protein